MLPYLKEVGQTNPDETNFLAAKKKEKPTLYCIQIKVWIRALFHRCHDYFLYFYNIFLAI